MANMLFKKILVASFLCLSLSFLAWRICYYFDWIDKSLSSPLVLNLTKEQILWDVFYGNSPLCGHIDCHLKSDYPDSKFTKKAVLPMHEWPLLGYKKGQMIYKRASIKLPEKLWELAKDGVPIVFHSLYIWAKRYHLYVNEQLIQTGGLESVFASIPSELLTRDRITIAFKIDPGDLTYQGIAHRRYVVIGPRADLLPTIHQPKEIKTTYYLWFLLPVLTVTMLFILLYLCSYEYEDVFYFVICGALFSTHIFSYTEYAESLFENGTGQIIASFFSLGSKFALLKFVQKFFRKKSSRLFDLSIIGLFTLLSLASSLVLIKNPFQEVLITSNILDHVFPFILLACGVYGTTLAFQLFKLLSITNESKQRKFTCIFLAVYFLLTTIINLFEIIGYKPINSVGIMALLNELTFFMVIAGLIIYSLATDHQESLISNTIVKTVQMIAHDLRKPHSRLKQVLKLVASSKQADVSSINEHFHDLDKDSAKVDQLLTDLLKINSQEPATLEGISLVKLINRVVTEFESTDPNINIKTDMNHTNYVKADGPVLARVFTNILQNALDYNVENLKIWIRTTQNYRKVKVVIGNNGPIIPKKVLKNIFEPFYTSGKRDGTGLGLAIVRKIIKSHGGQISCTSNLKHGTEFSFALYHTPEPDHAINKNLLQSTDTFGHNKNTIIVIDDDLLILESWKQLYNTTINSNNIKMLTYVNPEAFEYELNVGNIELNSIHCIIVDYYFEKSVYDNGVEFAKKYSHYKIPLLLSTDSITAISHGHPYIKKIGKDPLPFDDLESIITNISNVS